MYRHFLILITFLATFIISFGQIKQNNQAVIGMTVSNLPFKNIINSKMKSATLNDFSDKLIILDFWATWCGPCVEGLPHMEKLQREFKDKIQVLTITDENQGRIETFLKKRPLKLPVVIDTDREINDYFKHNAVPHYVIIDRNKIIKAITNAEFVDSTNIQKLLNNEPVDIPLKNDDLTFNSNQSLSTNQNNFIFQSVLTAYKEGAPSMSNINTQGTYANRRIFISNLDAPKIVEIAYNSEYTRVIREFKNKEKYDFKNKQNRYCYELIVPEDVADRKFLIMQQELTKIFDFQVSLEKRKTKVMLLKKIPGTKIKLQNSKSEKKESFIRYGEGITLVNQPIKDLCNFLENNFQKPVIDETSLLGGFDLDIKWRSEDKSNIKNELAKYGLTLEEGEREIEMLIIRD